MSMKKGYKTVFAALMGCSMMTPAFGNETVARVQGASTNNAEMSIPKILLPVKPSKDDDNDENWNHIAIMNINMSGYTINNLITDVTNSTSAVNMETLVSYLDDVEGDNLGNHVATQTLNLSNNKITNLADAYDGADGDAVNVWTLKKYISEIPGDNLGNHVASQTLNLNNNVIQMGPITGYDQDTGAPIAGPGLVISNNMVSGLALPKATSDAANKEYVDGLFSNIKGDNLGNHTATQNINAGNFKVVNLALPTAGGDAANKTYVDSMISGVSKYKAGDGISIGVADANGMIPINVNSTVVRTSGNQRIGGNKNFTGSPSISSAGNSSLFFRSDTNGMKAHIYTNSNDTSFRIRNYAADNTTIAGELTMTATGLISPTVGQFDGNNKQISMVADPTNPQDAVNLRTMQAYTPAGDNLGNHTATQALNLATFKAVGMGDADLAVDSDGVNVKTLKAYVAANGDNLGNHTATQNINVGNFKVVNVAAPTAGGDATNKTYVDNLFSSAAKYKAGDGVSFGAADASGFVPINVDATVVRTAGNQTIDGSKVFTTTVTLRSDSNVGYQIMNAAGVRKGIVYSDGNGTRFRNYAADGTTVASELVAHNNGAIFPLTGYLDANSKTITRVADPVNGMDAVNLRTLQAYTPAGDNLGNHTATQALNLATFKAVGMGDANLAVDSDGVNVKTLKAYVAANGDNLGNHTATQNINVGNFKVVNVAAPTAGGDATNKTYVDNLFYSAAKYKAGDGVSFGAADASGLVPINVDNTVVRTAGNQSIAGTKTFTARVAANAGITLNNQTAQMMADPVNPQDGVNLRTLLAYTPAGDNLGNHTATQALNLATFKAVGMGDANLAVDSDGVNVKTLKAYVAANGDDLGNHTATTNINVANNRVINVAAPVNGGDVTNKTYVDNLFSSAAKYKAGDGVSFGAADASGLVPINVDATVVRTAGNQTINGVKSFTTSINVDSNSSNGFRMRTAAGVTQGFIFTDAAGTHIRNYATDGTTIASELIVHNNGSIYPATGYLDANSKTIVKVADPVNGTDAVNLRTLRNYYTGGSGVNIGSAGVVSVDNTVVRTSGNQVINGNKSFYGTTSFGNATGGSFIEDTTLRNYGNAASLGMQAGGYFPGYGDSTGQTWWGTTRFVVDGSLKRQEPTITGLPAYYSPSIVFGILKPSAMTVMDPNDNGFGVVMAMGYKHVRIYRPVKIEGSLSLEAPTGSLETNVGQITLRAGTKSTGSIRLLSNDADIILDPNFGVTGTSVIRLRADTWISGVSRASGGHVTASDRRLKKNIETITAEAGLDIIRRLRPVTYDFKEGNRHAEGLIAQEVREVMPHAVSEGPDGYLGVEYDQMIAPLIASVQDLDKQVQGLRAETVSLDARLDKLEAAKN